MQGGPAKLESTIFNFLVAQLAIEQPLEIRSSAAETLAKAKLSDAQKQAFAAALKNLGLSELTTLLAVFTEQKTRQSVRKSSVAIRFCRPPVA